jgi:hypothetical protein
MSKIFWHLVCFVVAVSALFIRTVKGKETCSELSGRLLEEPDFLRRQ